MWIYILIAGALGFLPAVSYALILMESWMIFDVAHGYGVDNTGEIVLFCIKSGAISAVLKTVAHALHLAPVIGQIANSIVAIVFVAALYNIADSHYAHLASVNRHPDTIPEAPHTQVPKR
jgi:hypothetical protein